MSKVSDIVIDDIARRNRLADKAKAGAEKVLSGVSLTSLSDLKGTLSAIGRQFVDEQSSSLYKAGISGAEMAKKIMKLKERL